MNVETYIAEAARIQRNGDFAANAGEIHGQPLKFPELRERLKHIASLCWGLSIDLQNEIELRETLERCYNQQRKVLLELFEQLKNSTLPAHEQVRFYKQGIKKILYPNGVGSRAGINTTANELTPEDFEARAKKRQKCRDRQNKKQVKVPKRLPDDALTPEKLAKRERKREYNRRYMEKKRAAQAQWGNNDSENT